jgi:hypothetical protein
MAAPFRRWGTIMTAIDINIARPPGQLARVALAAITLTVLADHWLWADQPGGALALVMLVLPLCAVTLQVNRHLSKRLILATGLALLAPLPLAEATSLLSFIVATMFAALAALVAADRLPLSGAAIGARLLGFALSLPVRLPLDVLRLGHVLTSSTGQPDPWRQVRLLLMPAALGLVFVGLFAEANPVIESLLIGLDPFDWLGEINGWRLIWVGSLLVFIWAFLHPGMPFTGSHRRATRMTPPTLIRDIFSSPAILRALILFNAIFAVETTLDLWLLWGGGALPDGMTFAEYAHRGAYPLILTALLAAGFVLLALRPGSEAASSPVIRLLVYVWVAQNILLVCSSIHRLDLYVGVYGLTYLRIAAFIWMGLVVAGLALIVARIALRRSGDWLIGGNLAALAIVLYASCFVDFAAMIAHSNIDRRAEEGTARLDIEYITSMGPHAIPAIDKFLASGEMTHTHRGPATWLREWRADRARVHRTAMLDWRAWTRRDLALLSYLDAHPIAPHTQAEAYP